MKRLLVLLVVMAATGFTACGNAPTDGEPLASTSSQQIQPTPQQGAVADSPQPPEGKAPRRPRHFQMWHFDAPVILIPLTDGELVPPPDPSVLGWWGRPSGSHHGTTLLTGHTVHTGGGEFDTLEDTPIGSVANVSGVKYVVTRVEVMPKSALAERSAKLFRQHGRPRLVLVTCEGYNWSTGEYADNVVVTLHLKEN